MCSDERFSVFLFLTLFHYFLLQFVFMNYVVYLSRFEWVLQQLTNSNAQCSILKGKDVVYVVVMYSRKTEVSLLRCLRLICRKTTWKSLKINRWYLRACEWWFDKVWFKTKLLVQLALTMLLALALKKSVVG